MGRPKGSDNGAPFRRATERQMHLYDRAKEVIEFLMDNDGYSPLTATEFAGALAGRYGNAWLNMSRKPNKALLTEVKQLMHDQHDNPETAAQLGGFMLDYAPTGGGFVLIGSLGEMKQEHLLHMLAGYLHQQVTISTVLRRSKAEWRTAGEQANRSGDFELTNVLAKIEDQIDRQGSVDHSTIDEFRRVMSARDIGVTV